MNGLELIKHTAGGGVMTATSTGGSVDLVKNGKIEFTGVTQVHVDKCFDVPANPGDEPLYDNYLIVISARAVSSSTSPYFNVRLRKNGTPNQTNDSYVSQRLLADDGNVAGTRIVGTDAFGGAGGRAIQGAGCHLYLYGPNLAQSTAARTVTVSDQKDAQIYDIAWTHNQPHEYDGIDIIVKTDPVDGSLTIYGFTKGQTP